MYKLVWSESHYGLEDGVNRLIETESYKPLGGPFVFDGKLYQALMKGSAMILSIDFPPKTEKERQQTIEDVTRIMANVKS